MLTRILRWRGAVCVALLLTAQHSLASEKPDFLTANIDSSVQPGDDFFQYSNGTWLKRNPIPRSEAGWGVSELVRDQLYVTLRAIHERAAAAQAPVGSDEQKIGDFWRTAMDVDKARKLGIAPLRRELARIDAAKNLPQVLDAAFVMQTLGTDPFFSLFVDQDRKESNVISIYAWQGGLGLPERDFYFNDEKNIRQIRAAYVKHVAHMLRLLGRSEAEAGPAAAAVVRFETAMAKASRKTIPRRCAGYTKLQSKSMPRHSMKSVAFTKRGGEWKRILLRQWHGFARRQSATVRGDSLISVLCTILVKE